MLIFTVLQPHYVRASLSPVSSSGSCGMPPAVSVDDFLHCLSIVLYPQYFPPDDAADALGVLHFSTCPTRSTRYATHQQHTLFLVFLALCIYKTGRGTQYVPRDPVRIWDLGASHALGRLDTGCPLSWPACGLLPRPDVTVRVES
jgi:hypothetical protein